MELWSLGPFWSSNFKMAQNERENIGASLKFECMSSHVILSLSQQYSGILRYISYKDELGESAFSNHISYVAYLPVSFIRVFQYMIQTVLTIRHSYLFNDVNWSLHKSGSHLTALCLSLIMYYMVHIIYGASIIEEMGDVMSYLCQKIEFS